MENLSRIKVMVKSLVPGTVTYSNDMRHVRRIWQRQNQVIAILADELQEMPTMCRCGKKARFNGRKVNGEFVTEGESVAIDNSPDYEYESLCGKCYLEKVLNVKKRKLTN